MVIDILTWVLIAIIGFFTVVGIYTVVSMLTDEKTQETDENGE